MFKRISILMIAVFFLIITTTAFAGTVQHPRTGQTTCFDSAGAAIACAGTGQDGDIRAGMAWPDPRFTVGAGAEADCVTDNLTGLMWPKDGTLAGGREWNHAIDYANNLTLCGHSDWRLPNVNELESLVNADVPDTRIWLIGNGFTNVQSNYYYWSSTSYADNTNFAWIVDIWDGVVYYYVKGNHSYVWPVRSGQVDGSFGYSGIWKTGQTVSYRSGDDGDLEMGVSWPNPRFTVGTGAEADCVTDNLTGLMWIKTPDSVNRIWQTALDYSNGLSSCGYSDWRLPNRKEQRSLIDYSRSNLALMSGHPFTNVLSDDYWSSTSYADNTYYAWVVNMRDGYVGDDAKGDHFYYYNYVWPVRSGQVGGSFDYYCDSDNDGHIALSVSGNCTGTGCQPPGCQTSAGDDCDDSNAAIKPGAAEICDGKDNDCDLNTVDGSGESWFGAACDGADSDLCAEGIYQCTNKVKACSDFTVSNAENTALTCSDTMDNDCDGFTDVADSGCTLRLKVNISGKGKVVSAPAGINCKSICSVNCKPADIVILTAKPSKGYKFKNWSGSCKGSKATCKVTMSKAKTVTAVFKRK